MRTVEMGLTDQHLKQSKYGEEICCGVSIIMKMVHKDKIESLCYTCHSAYDKERTTAKATLPPRMVTKIRFNLH